MKEEMLKWIKSAGIRAIKTFAQALLGVMAGGNLLTEIPWDAGLSAATVAAIASLLMSIAGLPELKTSPTIGDIVVDPETSDAFIKFDKEEYANIKLGDTVTFNVTGLTGFKMDPAEENPSNEEEDE